ncbi:hypothetical protein ACNJUT_21585, partial [Mycobacterium tuberculosis]
ARMERDGAVWRLFGAEGAVLAEAEVVILAMGAKSTAFAPSLPLRPVRGQTSMAALPFTGAPAAWGGYAIPTREGLLFGATHDRGDDAAEVREDDHARNLGFLAQGRPALATRLAEQPLTGRAGVRAATPDHAPLAGRLGEGLFV